LLLGFYDTIDDDLEDSTHVVARWTKKKIKSAEKRSVRGTLAKSGLASGGAHSKSSAASLKVSNDHPLCVIVTGSRRRKQNPKYL
jgi:hypothetical protein